MENLKFEESFKDAFSGAEIAPSYVVWTNVELGLEKTSGGKMKGRLLFFQLLAAASMVFAMGVGSVYFLNSKYDAAQPIAQQESTRVLKNQNKNASDDKSTIVNESENQESKSDSENNNNQGIILNSEDAGIIAETEQSFIALSESESEISLISGKRPVSKLVEVSKPTLILPTNEPDPGMLLLAKLRDEEKKYQQKKPTLKEKIWASLGMGAGTYRPNASNAKMGMLDNAATSDPSSGTSYSVGVGVAGKVSKRVVLQGGISYLSQNSTYTSSTASVLGTAALNEYASIGVIRDETSKNQLQATNPYQLNNNLQYMSIPLQAGYILVDRDFALQVNGGISTDVFFKNTLTPENSDLGEVSQGAGSDSPYRTLNFSGLLGTELSYKVGDHYRIAVNPGMRYALNSIYKSEVSADVSPITFDVSLRVRYMF